MEFLDWVQVKEKNYRKPKSHICKRLKYEIIYHICQILFLLEHIGWQLLENYFCSVLNIQQPITLLKSDQC